MWIIIEGASDLIIPFGLTKKIFARIQDNKERIFRIKMYYSILKPSNQITWILGRVKRREFFVFLLHMYVLSTQETQH